MKIAVIFYNIGGYHAARLRAAQTEFDQSGWELTAIQETDNAQEHPWGDLNQEITFPLITLAPREQYPNEQDRSPYSPIAAKHLKTQLDQLNPDLLVIPGWGFPTSRAAIKWARQKKVPIVLMSESKWDDEPRSWWKETIKSYVFIRKFNAALVGGSLHQQYLEKLRFSSNNIYLGYDIVDNQYFREHTDTIRQNKTEYRIQYPSIPQKNYFIAVNRFIPRKNLLRLIEAFAQYQKIIGIESSWDLVLCGGGAEKENIQDKIKELNLEKSIHLPGFKTYQEMPAWYAFAGAFIHPALSEQWGLVVNEAMASGLPLLISERCGCYPELVIEGETGYGFNPENTEQLSNLMIKFTSDTKTTSAMGSRAQQHISNFSPKTFGSNLKSAVQNILEKTA